MGRRYLTAGYARVVERARDAIPGVAVHADVIAGFPTEDAPAHARSLAFIAGFEPAGLHVFRYSARPGTPATRMAGQVDERTKKARAADLLALAAEAKARFARASVGSTTRVLLEQRLADGRWLGHAEDHVLVAVAPRPGDPDDLENALVTVRRMAPDRVTGERLHVDPAPRTLRRAIPVLSSPSPGGAHAG
jgi:threonylcarbamoyladenosine tRNA methylthiotransferase MtaB